MLTIVLVFGCMEYSTPDTSSMHGNFHWLIHVGSSYRWSHVVNDIIIDLIYILDSLRFPHTWFPVFSSATTSSILRTGPSPAVYLAIGYLSSYSILQRRGCERLSNSQWFPLFERLYPTAEERTSSCHSAYHFLTFLAVSPTWMRLDVLTSWLNTSWRSP